MSSFQENDTVIIAPNTATLDCCQGKRGKVRFLQANGSFLLVTDHFCPIERTAEELTLVPLETLAQEILDQKDAGIAALYRRKFDYEQLYEYRDTDMLARALLILDHGWRPEDAS